ncbi:outer membrane protein assembly factor BamD [Marinigracilibium pacificum]|uniref:Outer membrane protein assembly factor BamD n=1 Tax=Marinigracilibium pacificum TaxID=2729599 RepID=A0A848J4E5_9BACT|nr:outer membrane protein assembly factor BamD [Marinigracilibium pacificum]NMM50178.1 outer membrane protein assembly factor BamD [Marinigracilibium pacificum]
MRKSSIIIAFLAITITLSSCSEFRKAQKSDDWEYKYQTALKYYEKGDYYKAIFLFEEVQPFVKVRKEGEDLLFKYAYSYYHYKDQYIYAASLFESFYTTYARSEKATEARFMQAYCLYKQSPQYNLDQTYTIEAIDLMQNFLNKYPESEYAPRAEEIIQELRVKLEKKAYENAKTYYQLRYYKSAMTALDNFRQEYPDSKHLEETEFLKLQATYNHAKLSIRSKQVERYKETVEAYEKFVSKFPSSSYLKEAEKIQEDALQEINKLKTQNS